MDQFKENKAIFATINNYIYLLESLGLDSLFVTIDQKKPKNFCKLLGSTPLINFSNSISLCAKLIKKYADVAKSSTNVIHYTKDDNTPLTTSHISEEEAFKPSKDKEKIEKTNLPKLRAASARIAAKRKTEIKEEINVLNDVGIVTKKRGRPKGSTTIKNNYSKNRDKDKLASLNSQELKESDFTSILNEKAENINLLKKSKKEFVIKKQVSKPIPLKCNEKGAYKCPKCPETYENINQFESHIRQHRIDLHYKCVACKRRFRTEERFLSHVHFIDAPVAADNNIAAVDTGNAPALKCSLCLETFPRKDLLIEHMSVHDQSSLQSILPYCNNVADAGNNENMPNNVAFHDGLVEFTDKSLTVIKDELLDNDDDDEEGYLMADDKNDTFIQTVKHDLEIPVTGNPGYTRIMIERKLSCMHCRKFFVSIADLQQHMTEHNFQAQTFKCPYCPLMFKNPVYLRNHRYTHFQYYRYKCDICDRKFKRRQGLHVHRAFHSDAQPYKCEYCHKSFKHRQHWRAHNVKHQTTYPFQCSECGKSFKRAQSLRQHEYTHGDRIFACKVCGKAFAVPHNLRGHMAIHKKDVFNCDTCGKVFKYIRTLTVHQRLHQGNLIPCPLCEKAFTRQADLKSHLISHSSERPYLCPYCGQSFKCVYQKNRHVKRNCKQVPGNQGQWGRVTKNTGEVEQLILT